MHRFRAAGLTPFLKAYTAVLVGAVAVLALIGLLQGQSSATAGLLVGVGLILLPGLFSVRGYDVDRERLIIRRPGWSGTIDLAGLAGVSAEPNLVSRSISLWSTRGLFGFIGYGYKKGVGVYRSYVTRPSNAVLLAFHSGPKVALSPESPDEFIAVLAPMLRGSGTVGRP
jgi:hypothetical protein